ncbi:MAG: acyl-CoA/acyl-ACP dehydrogenase [Proteobacteria bacterium]|nr:acyl-CoA/acyl-ACP dehydrogenase [Pseudomonadota bacterium]
MRFAFSEEQEELREAARGFLADHSSPDRVRAAMETELGYEPEVWERLGQELGWPSVIVPEEYGGAGLGYVELVGLLELMGESLLCAPFFSSVCLAANALLVAGSEEQKREYLPGIAEGRTRATLAWSEASGRPGTAGVEATASADGADYVLSGAKRYVIDAHCADWLIVAAREPGSAGEDGIGLFRIDSDAPGVKIAPLVTLDQTRRQAEVALDEVRVGGDALLGEPGQGGAALSRTLDLATVALAAEQVGGAQRCLDLSVEYAKQRVQFKRPIGSFQAIKHKCANMLLRVESSRSAAYYAGWAASHGDPELPELASMAKAYCSDSYFQCAAEAIQIFGGVGFTWEYDPHLYFKRARASEDLLGNATHHRERLARRIL